jgi:6-phosphogluconate dehydrogenase
MELAMVGLGRMGLNIATRLLKGNHRVIACDLNEKAFQKAESAGAQGIEHIDNLKKKLSIP